MAKPGKRHFILYFALLLLIVMSVGIGVQRTVMALDDLDQGLKQLKLLTRILVLIQDEYVDPSKTDTEALVNGAIHGMVETLDRYSVYMEKEEAKEFNDQTQGSFGGLGIQIDIANGWLTVIEPLPNTPAAKAGLMSGDKIVEIEGESTKGMNIYEAVKRLKGDPGTTVHITIARKGEKELIEVDITRAIIKTQAVEKSERKMIDDSIGYIRLRDFTRDAAQELDTAIQDQLDKGMQGLILDLRDNVGGLLDVAVQICDLFIEPGKVVVTHRDLREENNDEEKIYRSEEEAVGDFLLAVLVNEFSASASEIVAGCIQDHHRGIIVGPQGHRTFGKGSVQTLIELPQLNGASLKLTTAKYFTPSGRSIEDEKGLLPDIFANITDDQRLAIRRANKMGYLPENLIANAAPKNAAQTEETESGASDDSEASPDEENIKEEEGERISVEEVFETSSGDMEEEEKDLYDIELFTAYQCLKSASVLNIKPSEQFSQAK